MDGPVKENILGYTQPHAGNFGIGIAIGIGIGFCSRDSTPVNRADTKRNPDRDSDTDCDAEKLSRGGSWKFSCWISATIK